MLLIKLSKPPAADVLFGEELVRFTATQWRGALVGVAELPSGEPGARILERVRILGPARYVVVATMDLPAGPPAAPKVERAPAPGTAQDYLHRQAIRNGWRKEDLEGASEHTGSITAGLTLPMLAISTAPPSWAERWSTAWPWELPGFRPPASTWRPPVGAKPKVEAPVPVASRIVGEAPELAAPAPEPDERTPAPGTPATDAPSLDDVLDGWTTSERAAAVALLVSLTTDQGVPSVSKYNYHADKRGIRKLSRSQYAALIAQKE